MKYKTREIKHWDNNSVYVYDYFTGHEIIIKGRIVTEIVNEMNKEGFYVSAVYEPNSIKGIWIMTKQVE